MCQNKRLCSQTPHSLMRSCLANQKIHANTHTHLYAHTHTLTPICGHVCLVFLCLVLGLGLPLQNNYAHNYVPSAKNPLEPNVFLYCICMYVCRAYAHLLSFLVRPSIYTMITANDARISELDDSTRKAQTNTHTNLHTYIDARMHIETHTHTHVNNNGKGNVNKKSHGEIGRSSMCLCAAATAVAVVVAVTSPSP